MAKTSRRKSATKKGATPKRKAPKKVAAPAKPSADGASSGYNIRDENVEHALLTGAHRELLEQYFGEEGYADLCSLAAKARSRSVRGGPRVLVVPGLMGSRLGTRGRFFDNVIWVDPLDILRGNLSQLALRTGNPRVEPLGVILFTYLQLKLRLQVAGSNAEFYPYDWRQSLDRLGNDLARKVRHETSSGRIGHVYLVAHSMGGMVAHSAIAKLGDASEKVRRLVMLGTPNYGSFVPVQALRGVNATVRKLAAADLRHTAEQLAGEIFASFPGLYQLLPFKEKFSAVNLYDVASWPTTGPGPRAAPLRAATAVQSSLAQGNGNFTVIAGVDQKTTTGLEIRDGEFQYSTSLEGDGTVPLEFALIPGADAYYVKESHGSLPNNQQVIRAVIEVLETGATSQLPTSWSPRQRGVISRVGESDLETAPFEGRRGDEISRREFRHLLDELAAPLQRVEELSVGPATTMQGHATSGEPIIVGRRRQRRVDLRLAHGSITEVDSRAAVLGLFRDVAPSGPARAIDERIGGAITEFTQRRMFSGNVGEVFIMPTGRHQIRPEMVLFAGLGPFDEFDDEVLRLTAENVARTLIKTKVDEFATVMIGAGSGTGLRDSLSSLVEGFLQGLLDADREHRMRSITLCEMDTVRYEQMKTEMLRLSTTSLFDEVEVTVELVELPPAVAPARAVVAPIGADPMYLIVREEPVMFADPSAPDPEQPQPTQTFQASVLTAGGKATVVTDTKTVQREQLDRHLKLIETNQFTPEFLTEFGNKLAGMVLPDSVASVMKTMRDKRTMVINDAESSRIPWETICLEDWFPAGEAGLSRKYVAANLSVAKWLEERRKDDVIDLLLVVNPTADLDGAEAEGARIREMFESNPVVRIKQLRRQEATWSALRAAFRSGKYDVVHYAGHAYFDRTDRSQSGIICHGNRVLSGAELAGLGGLPALVFFNACEAARVRGREPRRDSPEVRELIDRNVGLAEAFLRGGVANYVGTYWPVGDAPAKQFALTFYSHLLRGGAIGDALETARHAVREIPSVDWADYVHYGSPGFQLKLKEEGPG